jgi:hypothetical protein
MLALTTRGVCVFSFAGRGRRPGRPSDATATWSHSSLTIPTAARSLRSAPRETRRGPLEVSQAECVVVFPVMGWKDGHDHEVTQAYPGSRLLGRSGRANAF